MKEEGLFSEISNFFNEEENEEKPLPVECTFQYNKELEFFNCALSYKGEALCIKDKCPFWREKS